MTRTFPLLDEIDDEVNADNVDWNQNAFQTLLTSNLPQTTVHYYAIDVGLRRLESSLYETFWDVTIDALNDLSQFLLSIPVTDEISSYLYEAKCQLLMYASMAWIKLDTIRRRVTGEARMSCAAVCVLLLEQSKSYETPATKDQYSSCIRSMRLRYLKRTLIAGQWLPTLSRSQIDSIHSNHEQYIGTMIDELFSSLTLRKKINEFVDDCLFISDQGDEGSPELTAASNGFVFIRRFPKYNEKTIEKHGDLLHLGLMHTLNHLNNDSPSKLFCCVWILACMMEADQVSLAAFDRCLPSERSSTEPIDFEQRPITAESLDRRDIIVFLLLCAQQNIRSQQGGSTLHPYLLYSSSSLCTQPQIHWWQAAAQPTSWTEFIDHLATMRLADERVDEHPPKLVLLETAKILFTAAHTAYKQRSNRSASAYEQYAIQYLQTVKSAVRNRDPRAWLLSSEPKPDKLFFSYPHKSMSPDDAVNHKLAQRLIEQCERLARQCDELKLLPQPPSPETPGPSKEEKGFFISNILGADPVEKESEQSLTTDSPTFATSSSNRHADLPDPITEQISLLPPSSSPPISVPPTGEATGQPLAPLVDVIFSHMNSVNQWINRFHVDNEGLQNDIQTIRDRLESLNRATSHMIFSNVKRFQSNPDTDSEHPPPSSR